MRVPFIIPVHESRAFDIVGFGENSVDLVAVASIDGHLGGKRELQEFARFPGGQVATAMAACARLGCRTRYVGAFGDDEFGQVSCESLTREGIDTTAARIVPETTNRLAIILVDAHSGDRTVLWRRDPALSAVWADALDDLVRAATSGRMLLVDGEDLDVSTAAARAARRLGIPTIADVDAVGPGTTALLREIDVIIAAESFPSELTGYAEPGRALMALEREFGAALVCVTLGPDGSLARCKGREIRTPGFPIECVDSTGAGDVFRGAFAAACLRNPEGEVEDVLEFANAAAALNCRAIGARSGIPYAHEVDELLGSARDSV